MITDEDDESGDWKEWRKLVLSELKRLSGEAGKTAERNVQLQKDIARLNLWATIWGALGGIVATVLIQTIIGV